MVFFFIENDGGAFAIGFFSELFARFFWGSATNVWWWPFFDPVLPPLPLQAGLWSVNSWYRLVCLCAYLLIYLDLAVFLGLFYYKLQCVANLAYEQFRLRWLIKRGYFFCIVLGKTFQYFPFLVDSLQCSSLVNYSLFCTRFFVRLQTL